MKRILVLFLVLFCGYAYSQTTYNVPTTEYPTIQSAVTAAAAGDIVNIAAGTVVVSSQITLNKANLTIQGQGTGQTIIQTSGTGYMFLITGTGVTIKNVEIQKTDKAGPQNIIGVQGNDFSLLNSKVTGQWVYPDGDVSRALEISTVSGALIDGNTFSNLRQPGYLNPNAVITISNNTVYGTKGWAVDGANVTFTNNIWASGSQAKNYWDIAILSGTNSTYYTDLIALSSANNGAVIEDQRTTARQHNKYYVNAASAGDGSPLNPGASIPSAIDGTISGGEIFVANGTYTYTSTININKALTITGESEAGVNFNLSGIAAPGYGIYIGASNVSLKNMSIIPSSVTNGGYTIHASKTPNTIANISLSHITINNSYRTPFDMHGVDNANLEYLTAKNTTHGNGVQVTGCVGVTINNITTENNVWGGLAVYCSNNVNPKRPSSNVTINNNCSFGENNGLYVQDEFGLTCNNITVNGYDYIVKNTDATWTGYTFYKKDISTALDFAASMKTHDAVLTPVPEKSFVKQVSNGQYWVNPSLKIQTSIDAASAGEIINVLAGLYNESVLINKSINLIGAGASQSIIMGPKTAGKTISLAANNIIFEGFTVKRDGNNVTDWAGNSNASGISIEQNFTGCIIQNCIVTENRNGIYLNNTLGHIIRNNTITNNRTGISLVNTVSNNIIENNIISNNWTVGFVVYYLSNLPATTNFVARNNTIIGNWYSCIECKNPSNGVANPTTSYDFRNNWYGSGVLNVTNSPAGEPGYASQIPVLFGGTSVNPGGNDAKISGDKVDLIAYDPWIGKGEQHPVTSVNTPVTFTNSGLTFNFSTLPNGGGNVSVQRLYSAPTGVGVLPAGITNAGLWLKITSTIPNYTFNTSITIDVTGLGFTDNTKIMYYNTSTGSWVTVGGTLSGNNFTFTTNHFTDFAFVNTPATAYNVYLSSTTTASEGIIYPNVSWPWSAPASNASMTRPSNDWRFTAPVSVYLVPQAGSVFGAANVTLEWDNTKYDFVSIDKTGGLFDGASFTFFTQNNGTTGSVTINASRLDNTNFTTTAGNYMAKLDLTVKHPGYSPINIGAADFRSYDGAGGFNGVYVTPHNTAVKAYLGDVAATGDESTGDGKVDFTDLTKWAASYWKSSSDPLYKVKYDVGPTSTNTVYGLPSVDGIINFEDLVIFSISYGMSANSNYPKTVAPKEPVTLSLGEATVSGNETLVPVMVKGGVTDIRGMQLSFNGKYGKFLGVANGKLLNSYSTPVMVLSKSGTNNVDVDLAIMGADVQGLNSEGEVIVLRFEGKAEIGIGNATIRNSGNNNMQVSIAGAERLAPTSFGLNQNYPNPFNPSTIISYQLPKQSRVEVSVYNSLGQRVATLVNEVKEAGYYNVNFNASNLSSGVYFYQIKAGDFNMSKKMLLIK